MLGTSVHVLPVHLKTYAHALAAIARLDVLFIEHALATEVSELIDEKCS